MYDTLIAFHILELIQESLEKIRIRFSGISCPDDFLLSESGMMKMDSICMKLTAIGESIKNLDKQTILQKRLHLRFVSLRHAVAQLRHPRLHFK